MPLPPGLLLLLLSGATATAALPLEGSPTGPDSEVSTVPTWPYASPLSVSCWLFGLHGECVCARMLQFTAWTGHRAELCSDLGWLEVLGCYIQITDPQLHVPTHEACWKPVQLKEDPSCQGSLRRVSGKGEASVPVRCRAGVELRQPFQSLQLHPVQAPTGSE